MLHSIAWVAASKWGSQVLVWTSTVIVARILSPGDYGVVTVAGVYMGVLTLLTEFGINAGVVALREQTENELAQLNTVAVLVSVAGFAIACALAGVAGRFFGSPELPAVLVVMSTSFVISACQSVPNALLQRELRFRLLSVIDGIRAVTLAFATVAFAMAGFRYWTLVLSAVLSTLLTTVLILSKRRCRFAWPHWSALREQIHFSSTVLTGSLAWYWYSNADFMVAGRVLGQAALGSYSIAWNFANAPLEKISSLVGKVTPAYYSAVQKDLAQLRRFLLRPTEAIAIIAFPAMIGMALVAHDAVLLLLGAKWADVIVPLELLAVYACIRSIMPLLPQVLMVTGEFTFALRVGLVMAVVMPAAFWIGSHWGLRGIAAGWAIAYPVCALPLYLRTARTIELQTSEYLRALRPAAEGTVAMALAVIAIKLALPSSLGIGVRLAAQVVTGALVYGAVLMLLHRERINSFLSAAKALRS
jgi:PST family polysaccharide transporter